MNSHYHRSKLSRPDRRILTTVRCCHYEFLQGAVVTMNSYWRALLSLPHLNYQFSIRFCVPMNFRYLLSLLLSHICPRRAPPRGSTSVLRPSRNPRRASPRLLTRRCPNPANSRPLFSAPRICPNRCRGGRYGSLARARGARASAWHAQMQSCNHRASSLLV